jgi:exoribonuclease R
MSALPPILLRATRKYDDLEFLDRQVGYVFLQEIGVLEPFSNKVLYDVNLLLPSSQHSRPLEKLASVIKEKGPEDTKLIDCMADLRHDWKELNVFCIDSADAAEIDDGISIERIPGSATEHWVHVHIANPTAFIANYSIFSTMAAHLTETFYSPDTNFYLLPHWMSVNLFSLQPNRPCLTFSAKLNSNGEILEKKVQPAIVRKVHSMSYEEVNMYLKKDYRRTGEILVVGGDVDPDPERPLPKLTKDELDDLKLLEKVAHARFGYRMNKGSVYYDFKEPELEVFHRKNVRGLPTQYPHRVTGHYYVGDPIIKVKTAPFTNWFGDFSSGGKSISDAIVRECMLLASEISAKWASERNIPLIYRGILNDGSYGDRGKFEREVLRPAMDEYGSPPMWAGLQYIQYMGVGITRMKPIPHMALGLDHYTKTTSPLRRYGDMITHWQIESTLRQEALLGRSLVGQTKHLSSLPFSHSRLSVIMNRLVPRERLISRSKLSSLSFWYAMFAYRAMICNELPMKKVFNIIIVSITKYNRIHLCSGIHMDYGLRVHVAKDKYPEDPQLGDVWEYELQEVNVYNRVILGRLLRLVSRKEL